MFYQHNINENSRLAIWKIEETEQFYLERVPVKRDVSHPYKRLQHLAGRYLLPELYEDFPSKLIQVADTNKPFLPGDPYHFSISHCGNYAAAIASKSERVGVDIELVTPRIKSIAPKFLSTEESHFLREWEAIPSVHLQLMTIMWSAKEAIFKWYSRGQVDFREHIQLQKIPMIHPNEWIDLPFLFLKDTQVAVEVHARMFDGLVLAFVEKHLESMQQTG